MIYLSICIPTYNRSNYLFDTINSIIAEPEFANTDEVEIVVSDNCSTDDTEQMMTQFLQQYPSKIKYHRNNENILDRNFEMVLSLGSGKMLKLNNDTLILNKGYLSKLLKIVKNCLENNFTPFFLNGYLPKIKKSMVVCSKTGFISEVSFWCTWIGGFCISSGSFKKMHNFSKEANLHLIQVNVIMRLFESGDKFLVVPDAISTSIEPAKKGGYNITKIFLTNYFQILSNHLTDKLEVEVLKREKKKMLYNFILPLLVSIHRESINKTSKFAFDKSNYRKDIKREFSFLILVYFECCLFIKKGVFFFKSFIKLIVSGFKSKI